MEDHPKFEYSKITDQIYIGTNMCCNIHTQELKKMRLHAEIDLEEERTENPPEVDVYLWLPVLDMHAPSHTQIEVGVAVLDKMVREGHKIYVHCKFGHGRSPTLVAAYFIFTGLTIDQAINKIAKKRPEIHLVDEQYQALENYQKHLRSKQ